MHNSKLFIYLNSFEKSEWKAFQNHLLQKYRPDAEVIQVYVYIMKYRINLNHNKLTLSIAKENLFNNKTDKNFQNLLSKLSADVLDYFAIENMQRDSREVRLHQVQSLNRRGLYPQANEYFNLFHDEMEDAKLDIWNEWYKVRALHAQKYSDNPIKVGRDNEVWEELVEKWILFKDQLNLFYRVDAANVKQLYDCDLDDTIRNQLSTLNPPSNDKLTQLLFNLEQLQSVEDTRAKDLSDRLTEFLKEDGKQLSDYIGILTLLIVINHERRKSFKGQLDVPKLLSLYKYGLKTGYLTDRGQIELRRYMTVVNFYCHEEQFDEAELYIEEWKDAISHQEQNIVIQLVKANVELFKCNGAKAIEILNGIFPKSSVLKRVLRSYLLLAYFLENRDDVDFMEAQYRNYLQFTERRKDNHISVNRHTKSENNLVKTLRYISKEKDAVKVKDYLERHQPNSRNIWLNFFIKKKLNSQIKEAQY